MQNDFSIREYQGKDLPSLAKIYSSAIRHLGAEHYSKSQILAWSSFSEDAQGFRSWLDKSMILVAAGDNGRCLGFGGLERCCRISSLFVGPEFQRKGIASRLLTHLLDKAKAGHVEIVTTEASEFSKPLFEKFGFELTAIEHTEFKGVRFSRYAMQLHIY